MLALSNLYSNWNISREYFKILTVSVLRFQCTNVADRLRDGRTDTERQQRPRLRKM